MSDHGVIGGNHEEGEDMDKASKRDGRWDQGTMGLGSRESLVLGVNEKMGPIAEDVDGPMEGKLASEMH